MSKDKSKKCVGDECNEPTHMCKIAKTGDADLIRSIVKEPSHFCKKCARAANNAKHLCKPVAI